MRVIKHICSLRKHVLTAMAETVSAKRPPAGIFIIDRKPFLGDFTLPNEYTKEPL
jgi:hypothetical protein